ncbi:UvrD-helicase domain-containing protein [Salinimicrobium sp. MT39]|uniref:DNA 3'-5' helicase n=1 Tax=Salinimicrobium profundisediminis TaxID=2994553 RepID=A0A9X3CZG0_9FLAO|nr:UvrD-helicase domain-containing protein [Salinimicrobium profundisediminis]MCX2839519.1 UvrD-helicase domain-containing protein [Salinimicrobium profundisediminis]
MKDANIFRIYDASAGSGKTYTLVKQYLLLLLSSPRIDSYKNILAITFTNKAVGEMKSRIIESLHGLANPSRTSKEEELLTVLSKDTGMPPEIIQKRSSDILKHIIHNYAAFEVSTIDGFTHRVLRTFAKDLGLPLNFEVELRTDEVLGEAVDRLISKAGKDKAITRVLVNFVLSRTDDDKSWDIARDLFAIGRLLTQETSSKFLEILKTKKPDDFEDLKKKIIQEQKKLESAVIDTANDFFQLLDENNLDNGCFSGGYCPKFFLKLQKGDFNVNFSAGWQRDLAEKALYASKLDAAKKQVLDSLQPQIVALYNQVKKFITSIQFLEAVDKNLVPLSLLNAIQAQIEEIKAENSLVLISEFNATIGKAVKDQPAPFIYERLGDRYRHYFIDEFQDTSQLQWENLIPLVDNTLSIEHPAGEFGSLTLVGDAKQSIYRWRGGKAEQFMELCQKRHPFSVEDLEMLVLPNNYRSARTVVEFNNDFFKYASGFFLNETHKNLFLNSGQGVVSSKEGYVNISFIEAENASEEMEAYPIRVLEIITKVQEQGRALSDICILTRTRRESIAVANYLSEHAIPVISAESLLINRSPKIRFITAVLQYCLDPGDRSLKFEILDYLLTETIEVDNDFQFLEEHLKPEGEEFFKALEKNGINFSPVAATAMSVYEAVEYIIRAFSLEAVSDAYLQFYLDFVYEVSSTEGVAFFTFLEQWERKKDELSIVVPKGENAVQIMTIHKAKGLEFPVVIYPFANTQINDTAREHFWIELPEELDTNVEIAYLRAADKMKEWDGEAPQIYHELSCNSQLDALNVLYVAMTRPEHQLYIISKMDLDKKGNENTNRISGLFISYLRSIGKWNDSNEYHFGNMHEMISEEKKPSNTFEQQSFFSSPTQGNGISIITRSGLMWNTKQQKAIEKGQLIHDLFAKIDTEADVERVLENGKNDGLFPSEEKEELKRSILEVTGHSALRKYFANGVVNYNERAIISEDGALLRPDRLIFSGNKVNIIDYKTGASDPKHKAQISEYAHILAKMDFEIENKILVYINDQIEVTFV